MCSFLYYRQRFTNLTCSLCVQIPHLSDFKNKVLTEDYTIDKRSCRTTSTGRKVGYLTVVKLVCDGKDLRKWLRLEKLHHWDSKARIVQLKVKWPTLREMARQSSSEHNLFKFCNNILNAYRMSAFGSRLALLDFIKDVVYNLNHKGHGHRYSKNNKYFAQVMKVYGGKRMCDVFSLNYSGRTIV